MNIKRHLNKIAFLIAMALALNINAQLVNGDFESWTADAPDGWTTIEDGIALSQESSIIHGGTSSAAINVLTATQGDTDFRQSVSVVAGATYNISFWAYHTEGNMRARLYAGDYQDYTVPETIGEWQQLTFSYLAAATEEIEVGLRFYDLPAFDGEEIVYIDDFVMEEEVIVGPSIVITTPEEAAFILSDEVSVEVIVQNFVIGDPSAGSFDGYFTHDLDGTTGDHFDTDPFTLSGLSDGAHVLTVTLVDEAGSPLTPSVTYTVNFTTEIPLATTVSDIATLRAGTIGEIYELSGEAVLTYQQSFRNQKMIQDATGGILIDDNDGNITTTYSINDGITGITGTLGEFGNMMQFVPLSDPGAASSSDNSVSIPTITLNDLVTNFEEYESELVTIENISFTTIGAGTLENGMVYDISDGVTDYELRTTFFDVDYIGTTPTAAAYEALTGIPNSRTEGDYFTPRDFGDFATSIVEYNSLNVSVYPNPSEGVFHIQNGNNTIIGTINIYDITGKVVFSNSTNLRNGEKLTIETSDLESGMYFLNINDSKSNISSTIAVMVN